MLAWIDLVTSVTIEVTLDSHLLKAVGITLLMRGRESLPLSLVSMHYPHSWQTSCHPAGLTMILCCVCSLDPWFACTFFVVLFHYSYLSFVCLFCFPCPSFYFVCSLSLVGCTSCVCLCCHFLSSAGVWATESKGDHSGSARQLDSGSRCGVLLTFSPPEPSFVLFSPP